jgi:hypothetical protein
MPLVHLENVGYHPDLEIVNGHWQFPHQKHTTSLHIKLEVGEYDL